MTELHASEPVHVSLSALTTTIELHAPEPEHVTSHSSGCTHVTASELHALSPLQSRFVIPPDDDHVPSHVSAPVHVIVVPSAPAKMTRKASCPRMLTEEVLRPRVPHHHQ